MGSVASSSEAASSSSSLKVLSDLVERLEGRRRRRFRSIFVDGDDPHYWEGFPVGEDEYSEWKLRRSAQEMLELLDRMPDVADVLLNNFLLVKPGGRKVVWFSDVHVIVCEGFGENDRFPRCHIPDHHLDVSSNDSHRSFLTVKTHETFHPDEEDERDVVLHLLHKIVALGTCITKVDMRFGDESLPEDVPGIQDHVSLARSRRMLEFNSGVSTDLGRILAYQCNPLVELDARVGDWEDEGLVLAEAMWADQCPTRLALSCFRGNTSAIIAPALAATTRIQELRFLLPMNDNDDVWDAAMRNRGIRAMVMGLIGIIGYGSLSQFWKAALTHDSIDRIDATEVADELHPAHFENQRRECTEMIAKLIRSNPRITSLTYDPLAYDAHIMTSRVMPIVHLNRFRPIVKSIFDDGPTAPSVAATSRAQAKDVSSLIGSPLVRCNPELLYVLLKAGRDYLLPGPLTDAGGQKKRAARD